MYFLALRPAWMRLALLAFTLVLLCIGARVSGAQARPISQHRINELAAILLRAHRAIIEEPGLRLDGERLEVYTNRIAAPLSGESEVRHAAREERYISALEHLAAPENLCAALPVLVDNSPPNVTLWQKVARASASLPARVARARDAWSACRHASGGHADTQRLGRALTQSIYAIKSACDSLRAARP